MSNNLISFNGNQRKHRLVHIPELINKLRLFLLAKCLFIDVADSINVFRHFSTCGYHTQTSLKLITYQDNRFDPGTR